MGSLPGGIHAIMRLSTYTEPREAWAHIWDHLKLLYIERLTASSSLFSSTYTEVCTQGIRAAMLRDRCQLTADSGNMRSWCNSNCCGTDAGGQC